MSVYSSCMIFICSRTYYLKGETIADAESWYWAIKNKQVHFILGADCARNIILCSYFITQSCISRISASHYPIEESVLQNFRAEASYSSFQISGNLIDVAFVKIRYLACSQTHFPNLACVQTFFPFFLTILFPLIMPHLLVILARVKCWGGGLGSRFHQFAWLPYKVLQITSFLIVVSNDRFQ